MNYNVLFTVLIFICILIFFYFSIKKFNSFVMADCMVDVVYKELLEEVRITTKLKEQWEQRLKTTKKNSRDYKAIESYYNILSTRLIEQQYWLKRFKTTL